MMSGGDDKAVFQGGAGGLTFDWKGRHRRPFWLLFFLVTSLVFHVSGFYLFQVVYPPQKRELLHPVEVILLDPADPLTSEVLSRIDDRVVAFDARGSLEVPGDLRVASEVRFQPSFEGYRPALRELPPVEGDLPRLFRPGAIYLPRPDGFHAAPPEAVAPEPPIRPLLAIRWVDAEREVVRDFVWPAESPESRPADSDHAVFHIGIDPGGRVIHTLPERSAGEEMDAAIVRALRGMLFSPSGRESSDWAWVDVRW